MQILLAHDPEAALAAVQAATAAAGWRCEPAGDGLYRLELQRGAEPGGEGYLKLVPRPDGLVASVWLPVAGQARPRLELCVALEELGTETDADEPQRLLRRLRRIEGQIRGLHKMVAQDRECDAIMTQFAAVMAALKQTAAQLVSEHLIACVQDELAEGADPTELLNQRLLRILF